MPGPTPGADHAQASAAGGGLPGGSGQRAEPGRVDEAELVQVGHHLAAVGSQGGQPFTQRGRGDDVDFAGQGDEHIPRAAPDLDRQVLDRQVLDRQVLVSGRPLTETFVQA